MDKTTKKYITDSKNTSLNLVDFDLILTACIVRGLCQVPVPVKVMLEH